MIDPATAPERLSDHDLLEDFSETSGEPSDVHADVDAAEIERQGCDR